MVLQIADLTGRQSLMDGQLHHAFDRISEKLGEQRVGKSEEHKFVV